MGGRLGDRAVVVLELLAACAVGGGKVGAVRQEDEAGLAVGGGGAGEDEGLLGHGGGADVGGEELEGAGGGEVGFREEARAVGVTGERGGQGRPGEADRRGGVVEGGGDVGAEAVDVDVELLLAAGLGGVDGEGEGFAGQ